jgi:hypothetical protein
MTIILAYKRCLCSMSMDTRPSPLSKTCIWYDTAMIDQRCISPQCLGHSFILNFQGIFRSTELNLLHYSALLTVHLERFYAKEGLSYDRSLTGTVYCDLEKPLQAKPFSPITCNEMSSRPFYPAEALKHFTALQTYDFLLQRRR